MPLGPQASVLNVHSTSVRVYCGDKVTFEGSSSGRPASG